MSWLAHPLPDDYMSFDCETTGLKIGWALPVEIGHCIVRDREVVHTGAHVLNWIGWPGIDDKWLDEEMTKVRKAMADKGSHYRYDMAYLRKHGKPPEDVLTYYYKLFMRNRRENSCFIGHNAWFFDSRLLQSTFAESVGLNWLFGENELYDTGGMEKSLRAGLEPHPDETTLKAFFLRVHKARCAGIKWSIETCVERYDFLKTAGLTADDLHGAGEDSRVAHLLFEEHRRAYE